MKSTSVFLFVFLLYLSHFKCDSRDIITSRNILKNKRKTLVSAGQIFELGLFNTRSKDGKLRNYVGIWYRVSPKTIVWVANRDRPIPVSDEILAIGIDVDGNLKVLDSKKNSYFSTGLVSASSSKRTANLYDSGNLVLIDELSGKRLWQSFDNPTDTFLPGMNMDSALKLTAWRVTQEDPSTGDYTFRQNTATKFEYNILSQKRGLHWKASVSAKPFSSRELPSLVGSMLTNFSFNTEQQYTPKLNKSPTDDVSSVPDFNYTRLLLNSSGEIQLYGWSNESTGWLQIWSEPQDPCDVNESCGKFGICNSGFMSRCKCLPGFDPDSPDEWTVGTCTDGCSRKSVRGCNKKSEFDTFLNFSTINGKLCLHT
ncbi:G-type lectin S-receptor-like serine/threonine-protein kinase At4g03230 [Solanum tuberosum]|uniref:Receptor kinase n=1 Tax=Solanum tuberosum TaxID=4113 RepID=M1C1M3_SOLTU|nr:PREDICTED: G-type lectin S-receptor-like serine/threonine-protein kinase At4g03230 [Solanum tuberosum]